MSIAPGRIWLFDLDNTLHDANPHIFPHINSAMTAYVAQLANLDVAEASALREAYWRRYGATLLGLMRHYNTDPHHFLHHTHQFEDLPRMVVYERALRNLLRRLPGAKIVFSNAPQQYAEAVLNIMGVREAFDDVCSIERMRFRPKPQIHGFLRLLHENKLAPSRCVLVEDSAENLKTAKRLGMRTVWISRETRRPVWVDLRLKSVLELPRHLGALG